MIKKQFLIPEFYIHKIPYCDVCDRELEEQPYIVMTNPPQHTFKCPSCNKEYTYREDEVKGEWKWRTI